MKKIIVLVLVIGMAWMAAAQQSQTVAVTIVPARGDIVEKALVTSNKYTVVYFGKQSPSDRKDSTQYCVVICPLQLDIDTKTHEEFVNYKKFKVFFGTVKTISEVKDAVCVPGDNGGIIATSSRGTISFPQWGNGQLILKSDTAKKINLERLPR